jgi:hypothetical protein
MKRRAVMPDRIQELLAQGDYTGLMETLRTANSSEVERLVQALREAGDDALKGLGLAVAGAEGWKREQSAKALAGVQGDEVAKLLEGLIKDADPAVRREALLATGAGRDPRALPRVAAALKDGDDRVRISDPIRNLGCLLLEISHMKTRSWEPYWPLSNKRRGGWQDAQIR